MKYAIILCLLLASCGTHRKLAPTHPPQSEPIGAARPPVADTSNVIVQNSRTLLDKVLGRKPPVAVYPAGTPVKAGKKSNITINNVTGGQTNTTNTAGKNATAGTGATGGGKASAPVAGTGGTATSIEKAKAPVSTGTGDATDQSGTGAASTIKGNNNSPVLTNAPVGASGWQAELAKGFATPMGKGIAVIVFLCFGYGVYRIWPLLRRKSSSSQA
jgi:hypothetical protein